MTSSVRLPSILSSLFIFMLSAVGCSDPVALTDCEGIVEATSCPVGTAAQIYKDLEREGSCEGGFFVDEEGRAQGICNASESSDCSVVCEQTIGCSCGVKELTAEFIECKKCPTGCGNEICDLGETAVEGEEGYCPSDCGSGCLASELRCNGDLRQSCNSDGFWEDLPCPNEGLCEEEGSCPSDGTPSCIDGIQNGDETGVDCGGPCPVCGDMIRVPPSGVSLLFEMGTPNTENCQGGGESPFHHVTLSAFDFDTYEVTAAEYDACVDAGVCAAAETGDGFTSGDPEKTGHPINGVNWDDALTYCGWVHKRLPTEAEWEFAAKGEKHHLFPWGDECPASWNAACCNGPEWTANTAKSNGAQDTCNDLYPQTAPTGSFPEGQSPFGVHDMAGNVLEWTADFYDSKYYSNSPKSDPLGPFSGNNRVFRGGSWSLDGIQQRASNRSHAEPPERRVDLGFRCASSL